MLKVLLYPPRKPLVFCSESLLINGLGNLPRWI